MSDLPVPGRFGVATPGYQPPPPAPLPPPVAPRRRLRGRVVALIAVGAAIALAALCWGLYALGAGSVERPKTTELLATTRPIAEGGRVGAADLRAVTVELGSGHGAPQGTPVSAESSIVGQVANQTLPAGTLVLPSDVAPVGAVPLGDQTVVGLDLKPSQVPTTGLVVGEEVSIVYVPDDTDGGGDSSPLPPQPITTAAVFGITADQDGTTSCEVVVPDTLAASIGADSARGDIVLIRLAPGANLP